MLNDDLLRRRDQIAQDFHKLYYDDFEHTWETTTWMGQWVRKNPCDLWIYQELVWRLKPDVIVETGTAYGGSALYLAHLQDLIGKGTTITIDIIGTEVFKERPSHPRISYIRGDSGSAAIGAQVQDLINIHDRERRGSGQKKDQVVMVILDAEHTREHVQRELAIYPQMVTKGSYLIVEDTNLNGRPVAAHYGEGPAEAIAAWLPEHPEFVPDPECERYYLTFNPGGYLCRVS